MTKACILCAVVKHLSEFPKNPECNDGVSGACRSCRSAQAKASRQKRGDEFRAKQRAKYQNNPALRELRNARTRAWRETQRIDGSLAHMYRRHNYGLTEQAYQELCIKDPVCAICGVSNELLVIDHDHETEKVRGRLCGTCNKAIGMLGDRAELVNRAVQYLEARC